MKILAVVTALAAVLLTGCTITPHIGVGYAKHSHHTGHHVYRPGHHHGHFPPGHWKRRHY